LPKWHVYADEPTSTLTVLRKAMLQMAGLRDYGAPEIAFTSLHLPLVRSNLLFENVSFNGDTVLNLNSSVVSDGIFKNTLYWFYANRCSSIELRKIYPHNLQEMNFRDFAYAFSVSASRITKRKLPTHNSTTNIVCIS
jgi:hypothetical protein